MAKPLITEDVAVRYNVSPSQIRKRARRGEIPHVKRVGDKRRYFKVEWLDAWDSGAELEVVELQGGGRMVRPKAA